MPKLYARSGAAEMLRQWLRVIDFLVLLLRLHIGRQFQPGTNLRDVTLIELGPGPTRLASIKRWFFREVYFIDKFDFAIPDRSLRLFDLAELGDAATIVRDLCEIGPHAPVFFFADHCIEHLPENVVITLLKSIADLGASACFRVPNVVSPTGRRNYGNDPTHRTDFNDAARDQIKNMGFQIVPWIRCYRLKATAKRFLCGVPKMQIAEEVAICTATGHVLSGGSRNGG